MVRIERRSYLDGNNASRNWWSWFLWLIGGLSIDVRYASWLWTGFLIIAYRYFDLSTARKYKDNQFYITFAMQKSIHGPLAIS